MSFQPKVSIIIPVYDGADFLKSAINSALNQSYDNCEIIVVNDGSNDGNATDKIAKSFGKKIRYYQKKNGGVATALNLGIEKMEGDYFSWLSHDDVYLPNKIQDQINFLKKNPKNREDILYGDFTLVDKNENKIHNVKIPHSSPSRFLISLITSSPVNGCTVLIPKKLFTPGMRFRPLRTTQDYDLWFRLGLNHNFIHLAKFGVLSRQHDSQGSIALSGIHRQESEELYQNFLKIMRTDKSIWSKDIDKKVAYKDMAYGLIEKRCFTASHIAFNLYQEQGSKSLLERVKFEYINLRAYVIDSIYHLVKS